jgi:hypothetical protein
LTAIGACTVSGTTLHITGVGSCAVTASQPGDSTFNPAAGVSRSFVIAKADQTISFEALPKRTLGAVDFQVAATASSGLAVVFAASGRCTVSGTTVHITGAGSCQLTASQPGDANFNAATPVAQSFAIAQPPCTVPKVVGKSLAAAKRAIVQRHCRTGRVSRAYSSKRKKGTVSSQSRRAGKVVPNGSKVDLVVSRGRKR